MSFFDQNQPIRSYLSDRIPFSFNYGGKSSNEGLSNFEMREEIIGSTETLHAARKTYTDPETGLLCVCETKEYGSGAVEWVVYFKNTSGVKSPLLDSVKALDIEFDFPGDGKPILHYSKGSSNKLDDFQPCYKELQDQENFTLAPTGGRPSNGILPFFNLQGGERGLIVAVGWSGQWSADFTVTAKDHIRIIAGMETLRTTLLPGEEIRTPSIVLIPWTGDRINGHNKLRKFIIEYKTPLIDGKPIMGPITQGSWGGTEASVHLKRLETLNKINLSYDYYWTDAGWYGAEDSDTSDEFTGEWYRQAGDWNYHRKYYPDGVRVVSDAAHAAGMKFLLWFEPERAIYGKPITLEHPEWYVGKKVEGESLLFNLGIPDAREWLTNMISGMITEHGVDLFRQDFNFDPLPYWESLDEPNRIGVTEAHYVEGLYNFWDELLRRHPGLIIDNCASGGRRIDMETTSRSIPLWRSDFQCVPCDPIAAQLHGFGLSYWIPLSGTSASSVPWSTYSVRCSLSAALGFPVAFNTEGSIDPDYSLDWHREMMEQYKRAHPYYYGEFYPLTEYSASEKNWLAYQMHRPDLEEGMVIAFRRRESPFITARFPLQGIEAEAVYELENADTREKRKLSGKELQELDVTIDKTRQSRLLFYKRDK